YALLMPVLSNSTAKYCTNSSHTLLIRLIQNGRCWCSISDNRTLICLLAPMSVFRPSQVDLDRCQSAARLPRELCVAAIACALAIAVLTAAFNTVFSPKKGFVWLTTFFFQRQDAFWLGFVAFLVLGVAIARIPAVISPAATIILRYPRTVVACLSSLVLLCGI